MQSKAKKYGEYVEITAPVERTTSEEYPTLLGGEIWYNQNSSKKVLSESQTPGNLPEKLESNNRKEKKNFGSINHLVQLFWQACTSRIL